MSFYWFLIEMRMLKRWERCSILYTINKQINKRRNKLIFGLCDNSIYASKMGFRCVQWCMCVTPSLAKCALSRCKKSLEQASVDAWNLKILFSKLSAYSNKCSMNTLIPMKILFYLFMNFRWDWPRWLFEIILGWEASR